MNQDKIKEIKQKYPKGTRIMLNSMDDSHHPVPSGTLGTEKQLMILEQSI